MIFRDREGRGRKSRGRTVEKEGETGSVKIRRNRGTRSMKEWRKGGRAMCREREDEEIGKEKEESELGRERESDEC